MNFTILGARGWIGSHLAQALRARGASVYTPARSELLDAAFLARPLGHVIYAIGLTADFRQRPFDTVRAHVGLLPDLLETAQFESFLYLSSTRVYQHSAHGKLTEALSVRPQEPGDLYNLSKLAGEALCLACARPTVRVARLANVVGPGNPNPDNFVDALCRSALRGHIQLHSALASRKDYILLDDAVNLLPGIACSGQQRLYNIASGSELSHQEWVDAMCEQTGCTLAVDEHAPVQNFPAIDITATKNEFGFSPLPVLPILPDLLEALRQASR